MDIAELFADAAEIDPARPFITFYDDASGERTELSYLTLDNWVSKTANLLVDDAGLGPGDVAGVDMPGHWLTAAVMLGCWRAGLAIAHEPSSTDVWFASEERLDAAGGDEVYAVAVAPMAVGLRDEAAKAAVADGKVSDYLVEVRAHGDGFTPPEPISVDDPALVDMPRGAPNLSRRQVVAAAHRRAEELGATDGERLLIAGDVIPPLDWLLAPLAVKGSVVLCRNSDPDKLPARAERERARIARS
ncbi:MAG: TIGR03089 family protein [Stackebrandtia sp.]